MNNLFKVRLATKEDIDAIVLLAEEWHPIHEALEREIRRETLKETLSKEGHEIFVATEGEKIIGWFDVRAYLDWYMLRYAVHVEHIFVVAGHRNKGVGSLILTKIKEYYNKLGVQSKMNLMFFYSEGAVDRFFVKNDFYVSQQHFYIHKERMKRKPLGVD